MLGPDVDPFAGLVMWGSNTENTAGGKVIGSVVDGPGCFARYRRKATISSWIFWGKYERNEWSFHRAIFGAKGDDAYRDLSELGVLLS